MDPKLTLSVPETATLLGISRGHAYQLVARRELPAIRLGRRVLIPREAIEQLLHAEETLRETLSGNGRRRCWSVRCCPAPLALVAPFADLRSLATPDSRVSWAVNTASVGPAKNLVRPPSHAFGWLTMAVAGQFADLITTAEASTNPVEQFEPRSAGRDGPRRRSSRRASLDPRSHPRSAANRADKSATCLNSTETEVR
jgi:excisionase family DNA binding protein